MKWSDHLIRRACSRQPDQVIGGHERPYLLRWYLTPWSGWYRDNGPHPWWARLIVKRLPGVYLHHFLRSDDDRALHDHPWANLSILLRGRYVEHTIGAGGISHRRMLCTGQWRLRFSGRFAHRVELTDGPCWTLFVTGWRYREWGFHCPDEGWIHWQRFTAADQGDPGSVGKGCDA